MSASSWLLKPLAALVVACTLLSAAGAAHAETRTLKLYYIHTKEKAEITFKRNGRYVQSGLNDLNRFLRDWRRNEPTKMDPRLFDLVWEAYQRAGGRDYIHVVSAYRSPATNSMLRSRSSGVAKNSQHTLGKAMDFYIPGVQLSKLRNAGLQMGAGGVGYYPTSGSPFVHLDVGSVRHWPRMSRKELVSVFPNGGTLHVPSDGKPLPNYEQALAAYKSKGRTGATIQVADSDSRSGSSGGVPGRGLLAAIFGGGADEEEESGSAFQQMAAVNPRDAGAAVSTRRPEPRASVPGVAASAPARASAPAPVAAVAAVPAAAPEPAPVIEEETPERLIAALSPRAVPLPAFAPREVPAVAVAAAEPAVVPEPEAAAPSEGVAVAAFVPVPSLRPQDAQPQVADAAAQIRGSALEAAAVPAPTPAPAPAASPVVVAKNEDVPLETSEIQLAAFAPVPELRPSGGALAEMVAAFPQPRPGRDGLAAGIADASGAKLEKAARVSGTPASQRAAILASLGKVDADKAITGSVRTTEKAPRPRPEDARVERNPVVVPVEDVAARWALEKAGRLQRSIASAKTPSLAHNAIRTAPKQVYTDGFVPVMKEPDPARFSGNAVTFLSVATFDTN